MQLKNLKPNEKNPRKISAKQREMLAKALEEFGDLSGFVFNRRTKRLAGGHQRQTVMPPDCEITIEKKYSKPTRAGTVATGFVEWKGERYTYREIDVDQHTEMAMNLAANKHGGEFDLNLLNDTLLQLDAVHFDLDLTGFDRSEIASLNKSKAKAGEDDVPEPRPRGESKTKLGQVFILGNHRLMCGDATDLSDVKKLISENSIDLVFTDPPYGIEIVKNSKNNKGVLAAPGKYRDIIGDGSTNAAKASFEILNTLNIKTVILWGANYYASALPDSQKWLVWDKKRPEGTTFSDVELAWTNRPGNLKKYEFFWHGMMQQGPREVRVHPTQKPIGLIEKIFADFDGQFVLDLFGGSGSTLIACEKTERTCFMMELDPVYCDVIIARFEKFTGKKAKLISPVKTILRKT